MAKFAYNNNKNVSTRWTLFKLNLRYHLRSSNKNIINTHSRFKTANRLIKKL